MKERRTSFFKGERVLIKSGVHESCVGEFVSEVKNGLKVKLPNIHVPFVVGDNCVFQILNKGDDY